MIHLKHVRLFSVAFSQLDGAVKKDCAILTFCERKTNVLFSLNLQKFYRFGEISFDILPF